MLLNQLLASELTINLAGQEKPGTLFLAIYDNSESYLQAIKGKANPLQTIVRFIKVEHLSALKTHMS